ncbi:hypothetical protein GA0115245_112420 [Streptomyces sp. di188]|nr:hypothetical protein GA0115238_120220 [Streptomyces sp. di50b]SCD74062.1 hypothetical protein GA0115245_112420 [Streptomyces sp. di188]
MRPHGGAAPRPVPSRRVTPDLTVGGVGHPAAAARRLFWAGLVLPDVRAAWLGLNEPRLLRQQTAGAGVLAAAPSPRVRDATVRPGRRARRTIEACPHGGGYRVRAHVPERVGRLSAPSRAPSAPFTRAVVAAAAGWSAYTETHADHHRPCFDDHGGLVRRRTAGPGSGGVPPCGGGDQDAGFRGSETMAPLDQALGPPQRDASWAAARRRLPWTSYRKRVAPDPLHHLAGRDPGSSRELLAEAVADAGAGPSNWPARTAPTWPCSTSACPSGRGSPGRGGRPHHPGSCSEHAHMTRALAVSALLCCPGRLVHVRERGPGPARCAPSCTGGERRVRGGSCGQVAGGQGRWWEVGGERWPLWAGAGDPPRHRRR